jgi:hypothetical protein
MPLNLYRYRLRKEPKRHSRSKKKKEVLEDQSGTWVSVYKEGRDTDRIDQ